MHLHSKLNQKILQLFLVQFPLQKFSPIFQWIFLPIKLTNQKHQHQYQHGSQSLSQNLDWGNLENFFGHPMGLYEIGFLWIGTIFKIFVQVIVEKKFHFPKIQFTGFSWGEPNITAKLVTGGTIYDCKHSNLTRIRTTILMKDSRLISSDQSHLEYFCIILRPYLKNI